MTNTFAMPGQAFHVDNQITSQYGNGGSQTPYLPVITVPAGQDITSPAMAAQTGRAFAAIAQAIPHIRIADYATTHNPAFVTRDGRSTFRPGLHPAGDRLRRPRYCPGDRARGHE